MNMSNEFQIRVADWNQDHELIRVVRMQVFIQEQRVPQHLEWDGEDPVCHHLLVLDQARQAIGTARFKKDGQIGRMAVLLPWRNKGIGSAMLQRLLRYAKEQGFTEVFLNAQDHAVAFYERFNFQICSELFIDAGIPHYKMCLRLKQEGETA